MRRRNAAWLKMTLAVAGLATGGSSLLWAQETVRPPAPLPDRITQPIEIYYGTNRMMLTPEGEVRRAEEVIQAGMKAETAQRDAQVMQAALASVEAEVRVVSTSAQTILEKIAERVQPATPTVVFAYPQQESAASQPRETIVIREVGTGTAGTAQPDLPISWGFAIGGLGAGFLGLGLLATLRQNRQQPQPMSAPAPIIIQQPAPMYAQAPAPASSDSGASGEAAEPAGEEKPGYKLMGKYNVGEITPPEQFEIGPTYQEVKQREEEQREENENAAVQFILDQNLALMAEFRSNRTPNESASAARAASLQADPPERFSLEEEETADRVLIS